VVAKGDSLYTISQKTGVPLGRLQALNPKLHRRGELWVGDKVRLDGEVPASPKPKVGATNTRPEKPAAAPAPAPVQPAVLTPVAPTTVVAASVPTSMVAAAPRSAGVETLEDQEAVVRELRYVKEIVYNPDAVPEINCHVRTVQTLILPEGESIVNVQAGDDRVWGITPVVGKNVIFIKPLIAQKATNIVVATAIGNLYSFRLSSDMNRPPLYTLRVLPPDGADAGAGAQGSAPQGVTMPGAGVSYIGGAPMDSAETQRMIQETASEAARRAREDEQRKSKAREQALVESVMKDRNDDFKISYDWHTPFRIQNIFSASGVTYIRVIVPENRQPVLYVIDEGGKRTMANQQPSNVDPNLIIVDQTFRQAVLVLGKKEARISNVGLEKAIRAAKKREF
jgi:type IV secretory pathway VirB9-like protein